MVVTLVLAAGGLLLYLSLDDPPDGSPESTAPTRPFQNFDGDGGLRNRGSPSRSATRRDAAQRPEDPPENPSRSAPSPPKSPEPANDAAHPSPSKKLELNKRRVRRGIRAFVPLAKNCYTAMLRGERDRDASVEMTLEIVARGGTGRVELVKVDESDTSLDADFHQCLLDGIEDITFDLPPGRGRRRVTYPFEFRANRRGDAVP